MKELGRLPFSLSLEVPIIYIANERVKRKKAKAIERDNTMAKIMINIPA